MVEVFSIGNAWACHVEPWTIGHTMKYDTSIWNS